MQPTGGMAQLTQRERDVVLVADGMRNQELHGNSI
jgi:DNA-binding CsgD family transcriptional regulator